MALIDCPECGREVSDRAPACIHCGYPFTVREEAVRTEPELVFRAATATRGNDALESEVPIAWPRRYLDEGLSKTVVFFLRLTAGLFLAQAGVAFMHGIDDLPGAVSTSTDLTAISGWIWMASVLTFLVTGVLFVVWFFQAYKSAESRGATQTKWGAGWTIGGWFVPAAQFVIPKLVMNEVDRMSNPAAGEPPINNRWRQFSVLGSSDFWWGLFLVGSIGRLALALVPMDTDPALNAFLIAAWAFVMGSAGFVGADVVTAIGKRLTDASGPMPLHLDSTIAADSELHDLFDASPFEWIRGYEVKVTREQRLRCLSCNQDVYFPAGQKRHRTHRIAPVDTDPTKNQPLPHDEDDVDIEAPRVS